ncbi:MAG TPA: FtsX-like permease family protein [Gemmatales bacterium]|nr:FtsX-like permease family protein [Gemmatales bacterium]HMP57806.1 FtsX-like permease family protein [Gemmatales bacterium]
MYKLVLCWRYLLTRYLALACVVSVMLGVATLIVVNAVMGGFANKLMTRIRGLQSDIIIEHRNYDGMENFARKVELVKQVLGDEVAAVSPVIETFALLRFKLQRYYDVIQRPVRVIGIDPTLKSEAGVFKSALQNPAHRDRPESVFEVSPELLRKHWQNYYNTPAPGGLAAAPMPQGMPIGVPGSSDGSAPPAPDLPPPDAPTPPPEEARVFAAVVGWGIATFRSPKAHLVDEEKDVSVLAPGDEITLMFVSSGVGSGDDYSVGVTRPMPAKFIVTDLFRCEMSEIDSNIIFIDIQDMQRLRGIPGRATSLQIRLTDGPHDTAALVERLRAHFPEGLYLVNTWMERQGMILSAIAIERAILNVLLFLIIAVAGFGILAIFSMIVIEKTRDIGILKSLGASSRGVMGIFLSYGLLLGLVGAGLGTALGVTITVYINELEWLIARTTGQEIFRRDIYYFDKIPTEIDALSIAAVNIGAVLIAVGSSVVPALRAALLQPVQALRSE